MYDGVEFKIIALTSNGQEQTLFTHNLQPISNPQERGIQSAKIDLSQIDSTKFFANFTRGE